MPIMSNRPLSGLLRGSPFKPIQQHMQVVFSCLCLMPPLFDSVFKQEQSDIEEISGKIKRLETEADKLKTTFRLNMPKSLFLPVDRKDLLNLISSQDKLADSAEDIAKIFLFRTMIVPEKLQPFMDELLEGTMEIAAAAKEMIEQLDELLEVGFSSREIDNVSGMIAGVRRSEHSIDQILHRTRSTLFSMEQSLDPVSVMFWYRIIDLVGDISDQSENLADRVLLFLSR